MRLQKPIGFILLALSVCQVPTSAHAERNSIFFVNGVFNDDDSSRVSMDMLTEEYRAYLDLSESDFQERFADPVLLYNKTGSLPLGVGKLQDLYQLAAQQFGQGSPEEDWYQVLMKGTMTPEEVAFWWPLAFLGGESETLGDIISFATTVESSAAQGKVVVVAHSQGSEFAAELYELIDDSFAENVRFVFVNAVEQLDPPGTTRVAASCDIATLLSGQVPDVESRFSRTSLDCHAFIPTLRGQFNFRTRRDLFQAMDSFFGEEPTPSQLDTVEYLQSAPPLRLVAQGLCGVLASGAVDTSSSFVHLLLEGNNLDVAPIQVALEDCEEITVSDEVVVSDLEPQRRWRRATCDPEGFNGPKSFEAEGGLDGLLSCMGSVAFTGGEERPLPSVERVIASQEEVAGAGRGIGESFCEGEILRPVFVGSEFRMRILGESLHEFQELRVQVDGCVQEETTPALAGMPEIGAFSTCVPRTLGLRSAEILDGAQGEVLCSFQIEVENDPSEAPEDDFQVNRFASGLQVTPDVAVLPGGFATVWRGPTDSSSPFDAAIHLRVFDADGIAVTDDIKVSGTLSASRQSPKISANSSGQILIVWVDQTSSSPPSIRSNIKGRWYSPSGSPITGEFVVNELTQGPSPNHPTGEEGINDFVQRAPDVAVHESGVSSRGLAELCHQRERL